MNGIQQLGLGLLFIVLAAGLIRAAETWWHRRPRKRDWGYEMQMAAEKHLEACNDALWLEEEAGCVDSDGPAIAPFCGCGTCIVREVLVAAWPVMQEMVLDSTHRGEVRFSLIAKPHDDE